MKTLATLTIRAVLCAALALLTLSNAAAATTQISNAPLVSNSAIAAKPNIFYVLDDSGSMAWNYLPDWADTDYSANNYQSGNIPAALLNNSGYNGLAYNPAVTYSPPVTYANVPYPSMTSANTSSWTKVPMDGFGVQSNNSNGACSGASSGASTCNLACSGTTCSNSFYYAFIPGEVCLDQHETTCVPLSGAPASYTYVAGLRWCTDKTLTQCQAIRIDQSTAPQTYTYARYPGYGTTTSATTTVKVSGSGSTSVSGITVNGYQILSGTTTASTSTSTVASAIATNINKCTSAVQGNCAVAGYSASSSSGTVTITAPASLGAITYTPVVTQSGKMTITPKAFSNGSSQVPGSNVLTTITSATNSYGMPGTSPLAKASTRTDCAGSTCTYIEEMTNYANWWAYYQTRMQMTKTGATQAFSALTTSYRIGYMSINNNTGSDFLNISDITTGSTGQMEQWYAKFTAAKPNQGTDTRMALSTAGQYYAGKLYNTKVNGTTATDPMEYSCQRNYTILSTDGYWNEGNTNSTATNTAVPAGSGYNNTLVGIVQLAKTGTAGANLGDQDGSALGLPYNEGSTKTYNTMADIAAYYYNTDIRDPSLNNNCIDSTSTCDSANDVSAGIQNMSTSTMGLGDSGFMQYEPNYATATSGDYYDVANSISAVVSTTNPASNTCNWQANGTPCSWPVPVSNAQTAIDDLWHTAVNGHGTYYSAQNPTDVKTSLSNFLSTVTATLGSAAAATVSSPNLTAGSNSEYQATFESQYWYGELAEYTLNPVTGAVSTYPAWSESGTLPASATTSTTPQLDNLAYTARNIYTYDVSASSGSLTPFLWNSLSPTVQAYFQLADISGSASPPALSQLTTGNANLLPAAAQANSTAEGTTNGAGGANLVAYLSGDRANETPAGGAYYRQRLHVLGDIVNSQPIYVPAPSFNYPDAGYAAFRNTYSGRTGMLYVGANDGMLHGFSGSTGAEMWDYIPSMVLPNLYQLADMNYATQHTFFVDGTPASGDVCFTNCTSSTTASWHTILVGGLGDGGRGYYALDVTNASAPTLLWEFTDDITKSGIGRYITDQDLGLSYSTPIITKLSDGTWAVIVSSGYNNVSPGSGHGIVWVLNAQTGAIIKKIDTGVGSMGTPSGLAKISGYALNASVTNQVSFVYGGDLEGNLWRMDLRGLTATGGTVTTQLLATLEDPTNNPQPITAIPELGNINGNVVVYIGTGQYLGGNDVTSTQVQTLYAIKDPLTTTASPLVTPIYGNPHQAVSVCTGSSSTNCFVQNSLTDNSGTFTLSGSITPNFSSMNGWFLDLPESGSRINTNVQLALGILVANVNIPGASSTACSVGGQSYQLALNYSTGLTIPGYTIAYFTAGGVNALANSSTLIETSTGSVISVTTLGNGFVVQNALGKGTPGQGMRRISWRELRTN